MTERNEELDAVKSLVDSLDEDQVISIRNILRPEQQYLFDEIRSISITRQAAEAPPRPMTFNDELSAYLLTPPTEAPVSRRSLPRDFSNPGTSRPESQAPPSPPLTVPTSPGYAAVRSSNGQFQMLDLNPGGRGISVTRRPGAAPIESNGQFQLLDRNVGERGIVVTERPGSISRDSNGQSQLRNLTPVDQAVHASDLAPASVDVSISGQSLQRHSVSTAKTSPVARTFDGGAGRPGGLAKTILIK